MPVCVWGGGECVCVCVGGVSVCVCVCSDAMNVGERERTFCTIYNSG